MQFNTVRWNAVHQVLQKPLVYWQFTHIPGSTDSPSHCTEVWEGIASNQVRHPIQAQSKMALPQLTPPFFLAVDYIYYAHPVTHHMITHCNNQKLWSQWPDDHQEGQDVHIMNLDYAAQAKSRPRLLTNLPSPPLASCTSLAGAILHTNCRDQAPKLTMILRIELSFHPSMFK